MSEKNIVFGIDWGDRNDLTVITVFDKVDNKPLETHQFHARDFWEIRDRIGALYQKYPAWLMLAESNGVGSLNVEALQAEGLPVRSFQTTNKSKEALFSSLRNALLAGKIDFGENRIAEQCLIRATEGRFPDETLMSMALAWHAATKWVIRVDFV